MSDYFNFVIMSSADVFVHIFIAVTSLFGALFIVLAVAREIENLKGGRLVVFIVLLPVWLPVTVVYLTFHYLGALFVKKTRTLNKSQKNEYFD